MGKKRRAGGLGTRMTTTTTTMMLRALGVYAISRRRRGAEVPSPEEVGRARASAATWNVRILKNARARPTYATGRAPRRARPPARQHARTHARRCKAAGPAGGSATAAAAAAAIRPVVYHSVTRDLTRAAKTFGPEKYIYINDIKNHHECM